MAAAAQEAVQMSSLRDALALDRAVGQPVSLDDRDVFVELRERPGSEQAGHAGSQDNGVRHGRHST